MVLFLSHMTKKSGTITASNHSLARTIKSFAFRFVLVLFSCALALAFVEIIFRMARPKHGELTMGFADSLHHHKLRVKDTDIPNGFDTTAHINKWGYRGEDFTRQKTAGLARVLFLGDSFTWGSGVKDGETFSAQLGKYFKEHNFPIEIINGGFASYSPVLHYLRTRDEHIQIRPDHVFLFYDLTDLQDDFNYEQHLVYDRKTGEILGSNPMYVNGKLNFWKVLVAKSSFARYLYNKVIRTYEKMEMIGFAEYMKLKFQGKRAKSFIVNLTYSDRLKGDLLKYDRYIMIRDPSRLELFKKHWARSAKYILMLKSFLAERGISFTLVLYPHGPQVSARQWRSGKVMWGFERDKVYDDPYAWNFMKDWAKRENVSFVDLLPAYKNRGEEELFFDADVHMTARGHEVFAEGLLAAEAFRNALELDRVNAGTGA